MTDEKIVETARAFLRWAKLYHEKQFIGLPAFWVEDLTPNNIPESLDFASGWDKFVRANFPEDHPWYAPIHQQRGEQTTKLSDRCSTETTGNHKQHV